MTRYPKIPESDFWQFVLKGEPNECWPWLGYCNKDGYGMFGRQTYAARRAYELVHGKLPGPRVKIRHIVCDNPPCCNPGHLGPGSQQDNSQDMVDHGRSLVGQRNPAARLNDEQVRQVWRLHAFGMSAPAIGRSTGIAPRTILNILEGITWKHVTP